MSGQRTSDFYRTHNLPERFDNPDLVRPSQQQCFNSGNPVFSCIDPPPSISSKYFEDPEEDLIKGYPEKFVHPMYRTTNMNYGLTRPNVHTMPTSYHTKSSAFTETLGKTGMYRNQGFNTSVSHSRVL